MHKYFEGIGTIVNYGHKEIIETAGAPVKYVYIILSGRVQQYFIDCEGTGKTLLLLSKGDLFGEITALQKDNDQVITQALTKVKLQKIPVSEFLQIIHKDGAAALALSQRLTKKIRILMAQIQDSSFCNVRKRLENLLYRLSIQQGISTPEGIRIAHKFTQEELASMISSTRSTVSKNLKILSAEGVILIKNKYIYLLNK